MSTVINAILTVRKRGVKSDEQLLKDFRMIASMFYEEHDFTDPEIYPDLFSFLGICAEDYMALESSIWFDESAPALRVTDPVKLFTEILDRAQAEQDSIDQVQIEEG